MDQAVVRTLVSQLAEDLAWLEEHSRRQPAEAAQAGKLRFAAGLVRNVLGPFLGDQPPLPLHLAVVGGAGAGKSTVANMLSGAVLAESNPQAGFTRHPVAYAGSNGQPAWPSHLGFLGPLQKLTTPSPANVDADVYQVRRVSPSSGSFSLLDHFVVWDCPDMTTWAATGYVSRLLEVAALADVLVYVASDERYNDEVPTEYLKLLLEAGKPVVVCLVKMREADVEAFVEHFKQEVLSRMPRPAVSCQAIPYLSPAQLADPVNEAGAYRIPLVNQVAVLGEPPAPARRRTVREGMQYLKTHASDLLSVARHDLEALQAWQRLVQDGQIEFDNRYRREYLASEKFHRFDEALVRLLDLLELPGIGKFLSGALWVVRTPYRLLKGFFNKAVQRPEGRSMPERPVLEAGLNGWLDMLRKEAARRSDSHPLWEHVDAGFDTGLSERARAQFEHGLRGFQLALADEVDRTARALYEDLEKNPVALNTLRGTKFTLEVAAIAGTVAAGGLSWFDIILAPLAASVAHHLVELFGKHYVDNQREQARTRQQALVTQYLSGPLADWLTQWPATGGSAYERLQTALQRIPTAINQLETEVNGRRKQDFQPAKVG